VPYSLLHTSPHEGSDYTSGGKNPLTTQQVKRTKTYLGKKIKGEKYQGAQHSRKRLEGGYGGNEGRDV